MRFDDRVAVTEFRRLFDFRGNPCDVFEELFPHKPRVHTAAASGDYDPADLR